MIKINEHGMNGYFTKRSFSRGEILSTFKGKVVSKPSRISVQIGENEHIETEGIEQYLNHSCSPNCLIEGRNIIAKKDIKKGDECTFNYNTTEFELANPFVCSCCGKKIRGKKFLELKK